MFKLLKKSVFKTSVSMPANALTRSSIDSDRTFVKSIFNSFDNNYNCNRYKNTHKMHEIHDYKEEYEEPEPENTDNPDNTDNSKTITFQEIEKFDKNTFCGSKYILSHCFIDDFAPPPSYYIINVSPHDTNLIKTLLIKHNLYFCANNIIYEYKNNSKYEEIYKFRNTDNGRYY